MGRRILAGIALAAAGGVVACAQIFGIEPRDEAVDTGTPSCRSGPVERPCDGKQVDVCTAIEHCGACRALCEDPAGTGTCVAGVCIDHAMAPGPIVEGPSCRFVDGTSDLLVEDRSTGLVWTQGFAPSRLATLSAAEAYCEGFGLRVPTRAELVTFVDFRRKDPFGDPLCFGPTPPPDTISFCSRSPGVAAGDYFVMRSDGAIESRSYALSNCRVRCVRSVVGGPRERFDDLGDRVLDRVTKLTWSKEVPLNPTPHPKPADVADFSLAEAQKWCGDLGSGFDLPTIKELASLVDDGRSGVLVHPLLGGPSAPFWSKTALTGRASNWALHFGGGSMGDFGDLARVRCVRRTTG